MRARTALRFGRRLHSAFVRAGAHVIAAEERGPLRERMGRQRRSNVRAGMRQEGEDECHRRQVSPVSSP